MSWIRPTSKHGMNVFTCDKTAYECGVSMRNADRSITFVRTEFRSASVESVLAKQLLLAGWTIAVKPGEGRPVEIFVESLKSKRDLIFLCPACNPRGRSGPRMGDAGPDFSVRIAESSKK